MKGNISGHQKQNHNNSFKIHHLHIEHPVLLPIYISNLRSSCPDLTKCIFFHFDFLNFKTESNYNDVRHLTKIRLENMHNYILIMKIMC